MREDLMRERLYEIIQSVMEDDTMEIEDDMEFIDDLGLSSMEFFNFISLIEKEFDLKLSDREIQEIEAVGDVMEIIEDKIA